MRQPREKEIANLFKTYVIENVGKYNLILIKVVAKELFISPGYINKCCNKSIGKTASQIINEIYIDKATSLYFTDSVSEKVIADMLGFSDESSFCHFFKNQVGEPISKYNLRKLF